MDLLWVVYQARPMMPVSELPPLNSPIQIPALMTWPQAWGTIPPQLLFKSQLCRCQVSDTVSSTWLQHTAAARLVFNEPKRAHVTPLFVSLHWLPVAARIQFKTLMLAYRTTTGSAPSYFHSLLRIYIPSRSLRSASEWRLVVPSQRGSKSLSRTFSFTVPGWWNDLPPPHPECWIPVNLQATTENSSLSTLLDFIIKNKNKSLFQNLHLSLYLSLLPLLACTYLNNAWDLVLLAHPLSVCLF